MKYKDTIGFGIAGNFANHLEQAGELKDFLDIQVDDTKAPKGIFPFYLPNDDSFLGIYPISDNLLHYPDAITNGNLQAEPEVALFCDIIYKKNNKVDDIVIKSFGAYNDCSIRKPDAKKISEKKNWGANTKGLSSTIINIDKFEDGGVMDRYFIASFLKRDTVLYEYGENSSVLTYSYFYDKLKNWIVDRLNKQLDQNPLHNLYDCLKKANYPKNMIISIGATRYTNFGQNNFLKKGDEFYVVVYDSHIHSYDNIQKSISNNCINIKDSSVLYQKVI